MAKRTSIVGQISLTNDEALKKIAEVEKRLDEYYRKQKTVTGMVMKTSLGATNPWATASRPPPSPFSPWAPPGASSSWGPNSPVNPQVLQRPVSAIQQMRDAATKAEQPLARLVSVNGRLVESTTRAGRATRGASGEMQKGRTAATSFGQGLLQIGYLADDAAYGMRGVMNNIAPVAMGLGLGMGVAGALQILGAALQQGVKYWDNWSGATKRAEDAAKGMTERSESMARATSEASEAARESVKNREEQADTTRRLQSSEDAYLDRRRKERADDAELEKAKITDPANSERVRKERAIDRNQERKDAQEELEIVRQRIGAESRAMERINDSLPAAEARMKELKAGANYRDQQIEELNKAIQEGEARGGIHSDLAQLQKQRLARLAAEKAEQAKLEIAIPAMEAERKAAIEAKSRLTGEESALGYQLGKGGTTRDELASIEAGKKAREQMEKFAEGLREAGQSIIRSLKEAGEAIRIRNKEEQKARETTMRDLGISEVRNPRRRRRLERARDLVDRTRELMTKEGMDPALAADVAAREQAVHDRGVGDRTIRTHGAASQESGLDWLRRGQRGHQAMMDADLPSAEKTARDRGRRALEKTKDDATRAGHVAGKTGDTAAGTIVNVLNQILEAVRKTPAEKGEPLRKK